MKTPARKKVRAVYMLDLEVRRAIRMDAAAKERDMSEVVNEHLRKAYRLPSDAKQTA